MLSVVVSAFVLAQAPSSDRAAIPTPNSGGAAPSAAAATAPEGYTDENTSNMLIAPPTATKGVQVILGGGGGYQFRTDLDEGGSVATTRIAGGAQFRLIFSEQLSLGINVGARFDRYEFRGNVFPSLGSDVDPWRDIYAVGLGAVLNWKIDEKWSVSGGPIGQFAGEESADVGDSASGGGLAAASYQVNKDLLVGGGFGVISRIEDDPQFFPVILFDWRINDTLRLTTRGGPTAVLREALELVWNPAPPFELAVGARYETVRFRLSEGNTYSDGIGQEKAIPVSLRASWLPSYNVRVDCLGGVVAWSQLQLSDSGGGVLAEDDVEPAPFIAAFVSIKF